MAEILSIVSIAAFSLAGVDIAVLVILWFKFDMLKIMGDLSGRNEKRSIARMHRDRQAQPASGEGFYQEFREQPGNPEETSLLMQHTDLGETTVLNVTETLEETSLLEENGHPQEAFTLEENILMVHTEERI